MGTEPSGNFAVCYGEAAAACWYVGTACRLRSSIASNVMVAGESNSAGLLTRSHLLRMAMPVHGIQKTLGLAGGGWRSLGTSAKLTVAQ